jgi:hypothetical protein
VAGIIAEQALSTAADTIADTAIATSQTELIETEASSTTTALAAALSIEPTEDLEDGFDFIAENVASDDKDRVVSAEDEDTVAPLPVEPVHVFSPTTVVIIHKMNNVSFSLIFTQTFP